MLMTMFILGFLNMAAGFLKLLPDIDLEVPINIMNSFFDILSGVLYFFPVRSLAPILGIILMLQGWRVFISVIRALYSLIPGCGG